LVSDSNAEISNESDASFQPDEPDHSPEGTYSNNDDFDAEAVVDTELKVAIEVKRVVAKAEPRKKARPHTDKGQASCEEAPQEIFGTQAEGEGLGRRGPDTFREIGKG
jgi:hypothetical protein